MEHTINGPRSWRLDEVLDNPDLMDERGRLSAEQLLEERQFLAVATAQLRAPGAPLGATCHYCRSPFANSKDGALVFYGAFRHHSTGATYFQNPRHVARGLLTHLTCGPEGYNINFNRIVRAGDASSEAIHDSLAGWLAHLAEKPWFDAEVVSDLRAAHELARTLVYKLPRIVIPTPARSAAIFVSGAERRSRTVSPRLRALVLERDNFTCRRCGATPREGAKLVIDHIRPYSDGGLTMPVNLQTLCFPCNAGKAARAPHPHDLRELT